MDCLFLALVVFLAGVFVINWQLWHSDQATHVAAARQAAKKIAAILDEAHAATATALNVSRNGCSGQGQFQLERRPPCSRICALFC